MADELLRLEGAVSATASGDLTWERWTLDNAVALGFSGQRNPLGFAVVRYLSDTPSAAAVWNIVLVLASLLIKRGFDAGLTKDAAWAAFDYWRDSRCGYCGGRGVTGPDQRQCSHCEGSGKRLVPESPEILNAGISCLIEAEQWMEGQLRSRLKDSKYLPDMDGKKVNLSKPDGAASDFGCNFNPRTSPKNPHS